MSSCSALIRVDDQPTSPSVVRRGAPARSDATRDRLHVVVDRRPVRALAAAVLETAADDLRMYRYARRRRGQRMYWQAYEWVMSGDADWPFSFVNVCDALHLSPEALRPRLVEGRAAALSGGALFGLTA